MSNTKISALTTVGYKASILIPGIDTTLPVANQNVNLLASSLAATGGGGGGIPEAPTDGASYSRKGSTASWVAASVATLPDAADLTGTPYSFVGFDATASPSVILSSKANTFLMYAGDGSPIAQDITSAKGILGMPAAPVVNSFTGFDGASAPIARTVSQAQAALGIQNATLTASLSNVVNGTITLSQKLPAGYNVASMDSSIASGSFTAAVAINGTNVGGLGAVAVSGATNANTVASAPQAGNPGDTVTLKISGATGSPTGAVVSLNLVRP